MGAEDAGYFDRRNVIGALEDRARGRPMELDDDERRLLDAWIAAVEVPAERFDALARRRAEVAGRKLLLDLVPDERAGSFFGLYGLTNKGAAFGMALFAVLRDFYGFRTALLVAGIPLVAGIALMSRVPKDR